MAAAIVEAGAMVTVPSIERPSVTLPVGSGNSAAPARPAEPG